MLIYNYYFAILILALIFYFISDKNPSILIAIIIIIIIGYNYFNKIDIYNSTIANNYNNKIATLEKDQNDQKINYLKNDKTLVEIILNVRFIKVFDNDKYSNIILKTEELMKIYIFMLGDRYDISTHFTSFLNTRNEILNELYSSYLIIPSKLKYIYNLNPYEELKKTIKNFMKYTRKMIIIIEKYAFEKKGIKYLQDTKYKPYNYSYNNITPFDMSFNVY